MSCRCAEAGVRVNEAAVGRQRHAAVGRAGTLEAVNRTSPSARHCGIELRVTVVGRYAIGGRDVQHCALRHAVAVGGGDRRVQVQRAGGWTQGSNNSRRPLRVVDERIAVVLEAEHDLVAVQPRASGASKLFHSSRSVRCPCRTAQRHCRGSGCGCRSAQAAARRFAW